MSERTIHLAKDWPDMLQALQARHSRESVVNTMRRACARAGIATMPPTKFLGKPMKKFRVSIEMGKTEYRMIRGQFDSLRDARQAIANAMADYLGIARIEVREKNRFDAERTPRPAPVPRVKRPTDASPDVPRWPRGYELRVGHITGRAYLARVA